MVSYLVEELVKSGALQFGDFTLTSGKMSNYYVDLKAAFTDPGLLMRVAEELGPYTQGYQRMAGTELGAVPVLVALALETGLPYVIIRKETQAHGTGRRYEGEVHEGERVLLVEDVTTTGGTVRRAAELLRGEGAVVDHAVCIVDREEGAKENLQAVGITMQALVQARSLRDLAP